MSDHFQAQANYLRRPDAPCYGKNQGMTV